MADTIKIRLCGQDFTAQRAKFGTLRKIGAERNVIDRTIYAHISGNSDALRLALRDNPQFFDAAYVVIAAHLTHENGMSPGVIQGLCDDALDEATVTADVLNALVAIQKLDYPEAFEKKVTPPQAQTPAPSENSTAG